MRLTTKGRFAVTAMIDLAMRQAEGPVTLSGISKRQKISLSYLEQLFGKLRRVQIVDSTRGPGGGYTLSREGERITVADIIKAVDEPLDATQCGSKGNCQGQTEEPVQCMTHDLWTNLNKKNGGLFTVCNAQRLGTPTGESGSNSSLTIYKQE